MSAGAPLSPMPPGISPVQLHLQPGTLSRLRIRLAEPDCRGSLREPNVLIAAIKDYLARRPFSFNPKIKTGIALVVREFKLLCMTDAQTFSRTVHLRGENSGSAVMVGYS
jgi:hypothetical protein